MKNNSNGYLKDTKTGQIIEDDGRECLRFVKSSDGIELPIKVSIKRFNKEFKPKGWTLLDR